jgi:hypothetical protein
VSPRTVTIASGWIVVMLLALTISLPYWLRRARKPTHDGTLFRPTLRVHYWIGYVIAVVTTGHALVTMRPDIAGRANRTGMYIATAGLALAIVQVGIGLVMRKLGGSSRSKAIRVHFWVMALLVLAVLAHLALSGRSRM